MLIIRDLISFLKKPDQRSSSLTKLKDKLSFTFVLLGINIIIALLYLIIRWYIIPIIFGQPEDNQSIDVPLVMSFFESCIIAPIFEELIFRYPLIYKRNYLFLALSEVVRIKRGTNKIEHRLLAKRFYKKHFVLYFYLLTIVFSFTHIFNFNYTEMSSFLIILQVITLPQLISGIMLGYVRIRVGLFFSILLHALFNFFILGTLSILSLV